MKFLIDANLPYKLAILLRNRGIDVIHTDHLPNKERTSDYEIRTISVEQNRIVITKDSDFLDSHLISELPAQLLYIATGNITNKILLQLIDQYFDTIIQLFDHYNFIELNNSEIIVHDK